MDKKSINASTSRSKVILTLTFVSVKSGMRIEKVDKNGSGNKMKQDQADC